MQYPQIDPVIFKIGPLAVHWYGMMYLLGFAGGWLLAVYRAKRPNSGWTVAEVSDLLFYVALGIIVGGRLGYMLFYDFTDFIHAPWIIVRLWDGGMAFHGGLLGVIVALWWFAKRYHKPFFTVGDFVAPLVPVGLGLGRIGNFINGELWGRPTDVPWGMIFPNAGPLPRHPSQLYEFCLEGLVLFIILWWYSAKPRPRMAVSGLFLLCYGLFRFLVEFFREPDIQRGYIAFNWLTEGQLLSLPMILVGIGFMIVAYQRKEIVQ